MVDIINFYNIVNEELRFERNSRKIEFITTTTALNQHIEEQSNILDLGAGAGAYSFYYAQKGHRVQALDITPRNIEFINQRKKENKELMLEASIGNAVDLSNYVDNTLNKYNTSYIDHLGTDGLSHTISDEVDNLTEEQFTTWLNYHLSSCREKSILGLSSHGLYICKKN